LSGFDGEYQAFDPACLLSRGREPRARIVDEVLKVVGVGKVLAQLQLQVLESARQLRGATVLWLSALQLGSVDGLADPCFGFSKQSPGRQEST
jgi:hypothetical protein